MARTVDCDECANWAVRAVTLMSNWVGHAYAVSLSLPGGAFAAPAGDESLRLFYGRPHCDRLSPP